MTAVDDAIKRLNLIATSRKELRQHLTPTAAVITIAGVGTGDRHPRLPSTMPRLRITANDIEMEGESYAAGGGVLFSERDAQRILAFGSSLPSHIDTLIVMCHGGASRSVAVVTALRVLRGEIRPPLRHNNRHIYDTILRVVGEELGITP